MNELDNFEIDDKMRGVKGYRGCYSSDNIPIRYKTGGYVVNLQPKSQGGSHWIAIIEERDVIYYCDSFGFPPNRDMMRWMVGKGKACQYNDRDLQAFNSSKCGYFAMYCILEWSRGKSVEEVLNNFSDSVKKNEIYLKKYFNI